MATNMKPTRLLPTQMVQNFHLVWLDVNIDENNDDCRNSITNLRQVVNTVNTFTDADECIDFITDSTKEKVFMVISEELNPTIAPIAQDLSQVSSVYIFSGNQIHFEKWAQQWPKIKGAYTDITPICEALKQATRDCDHNSVSISFVKTASGATNRSLDTLDCTFMYTQILKEILLTIDFEEGHINDFLSYYREQVAGNNAELKNVEKLRHEYHHHQPIWWYTCNSFLYSMLNRALRLMEVDLILKMGFFLRDLHNHIVELYSEQYDTDHNSKSFIVYRGQGLSHEDFDKLKETQGELLSFNNFLSTSVDRAVSYSFAESAADDPNLIGVFFKLSIDPSTCLSPFANVKNISFFQGEEEILFSMHAVFRIGQVKQLDKKNNRLWQVDLALTGEDDPQLHSLTESMRKETFPEAKGWYRLGSVLLKLGQFNKAQKIYDILLKQTTIESDKGSLYHQIGLAKEEQGEDAEAIRFYEKAVEIYKKTLPLNHRNLGTAYNNIGVVQLNMGNQLKALSFHEKALQIRQQSLFPNDPDLAASYDNIGAVYLTMGEHLKALLFHEKALKIRQQSLPPNHPDLALSHNRIGSFYQSTGQYSKALYHHKQAVAINERILPPEHLGLIRSYNEIGSIYHEMDNYSEALSYYKKVLATDQKHPSSNNLDLAVSYNKLGLLYCDMGEYCEALVYHEKSLEIEQKSIPPNHHHLAASYDNIGVVYSKMGDYPKSLSHHEKSLDIFQKLPPTRHLNLAKSYTNIGMAHFNMGNFSKALLYHEKSLAIKQQSLPSNHPDLANSYNNIGLAHYRLEDYWKALSYCEKAFKIRQQTLPPDHSDLARSEMNIGGVYYIVGEYSKALSSFENGVEILRKTLPQDHPDLARAYNNIGSALEGIGEYSKAISFFEKGIEILKKSLPPNHPDLNMSYKSIKRLYGEMEEQSKGH